MAHKQPRGGIGSNQYATRGAPTRRERTAATLRAEAVEAIADAVLTDLEPVRELLLAQAISASAATRGNWNDSPAEVLEAQGLSPDIIDWVLAGSEHATR